MPKRYYWCPNEIGYRILKEHRLIRFSFSAIASIFPLKPALAIFFFNFFYLPVPFDLKHELSSRFLFKYFALIYHLSRLTPTMLWSLIILLLSRSGFWETMLTCFRLIVGMSLFTVTWPTLAWAHVEEVDGRWSWRLTAKR